MEYSTKSVIAKPVFYKSFIALASLATLFFSLTVQAKPSELRVAFGSSVDIDDVALMLAFEAMEEASGIPVTPTFFAQGELAAVAVASDQADIGVGASTVWLTAIQKGTPVVGIASQNANGWSVMGIPSVQSCADIQGKSTAIHSEGAVSTAMMRAYIQSTCEGTDPNYLIIPGSENRTAALLAGEIDVTPVELIDSLRIMSLRPAEYHRIVDFAASLPDFTLVSLLTHLLEIHRRIKIEPECFIAQVPRFLEMDESSLALLPQIVDALLSIDNFPANGGLTAQAGQYTIDFFIDAGRLEPGLQASTVYDLSYLASALKSLGIQE